MAVPVAGFVAAGGTKTRRFFVGPQHGDVFWYSFVGSTRVTRQAAGCTGSDVEKKRPASVFKSTMVALDAVVEEDDEEQINKDLLTVITQFDDDGDTIMTDAWELDEIISTIPGDEEEPNAILDFSFNSEDDLHDDRFVPTPTVVGVFDPIPSVMATLPSVRVLVPHVAVDPSMTMVLVASAPPAVNVLSAPSPVPSTADDPFAMAIHDSVQSVAAHVPPPGLPEPDATPVASATTGPVPSSPGVAAVPLMRVPSPVPSAAVPFAVAVPASAHPAASPCWIRPSVPDFVIPEASPILIYPSEAIRSPRHGARSTAGPVSAPPVLRRSARLAAKSGWRNSMGTVFIDGRRCSARLASRAI
jgi:hypothetical protein